jgi:hypothetical protein
MLCIPNCGNGIGVLCDSCACRPLCSSRVLGLHALVQRAARMQLGAESMLLCSEAQMWSTAQYAIA